ECRRPPGLPTIGVGDGGNEIGMGKIPWDVIRRNVPNGGLIACRVPTDYLIVAGVSNWGAYALAAGVALLRGAKLDPSLFDAERGCQEVGGGVTMHDLRNATGAGVRRAVRAREWTGPTPGLARGYVQANLVIVPRDLAFDFLLFCQRNPKPCPLLDVTEPGSP